MMSFFKKIGSALSNPWVRGAAGVAGLASAGGLFDGTSLSDIGVGDAGGKVGGLGLSTVAGGANLLTGGAAALTGRDTMGGLAQMGLGAYNVMQRNTLGDLGLGSGPKAGAEGNFKSLAQAMGQDWSVKGNLLGATTASAGADMSQTKIIAPGAVNQPIAPAFPDDGAVPDASEAYKAANGAGPRMANTGIPGAQTPTSRTPTLDSLGMGAGQGAGYQPTPGVDNLGQPVSKMDLMSQVGGGAPGQAGPRTANANDITKFAGYSEGNGGFGKFDTGTGYTFQTRNGQIIPGSQAPTPVVQAPKAFFDKVLDTNPALLVGGGTVMASFFMPDPAEQMMKDYEKRLAQYTTNIDPNSPAGQQYLAAYSERRKRDLAEQYQTAMQDMDTSFAERGMTGSTLYNDARARLEQQYMNTASNIGQEGMDAWLNFAKGQQAVMSSAVQSAAAPGAISAAMNQPTNFKAMGSSLAMAR